MKTVYTQDTVQGRSVISRLFVDDLPVGEHQFWFHVATSALAQPQLIPVTIYKATQAGPKAMVTAGVHGDELNGILTAQQVAREFSGNILSGSLIVIPTINLSGINAGTRDFVSADPDASPCNLNRFFPGKADGDAANQYLHCLWHRLLKDNADFTVDLHTQTRGATYPLYVFADFRLQSALSMARLMDPDCILNDPGDDGVLETVWNQHGVPCITVEVGTGKITEQAYIERAVCGIKNILVSHHMLDEHSMVAPKRQERCIEGQSVTSIRANKGGFSIAQVALLQEVEQGELVAIQYDAFGDEIERYRAPLAGTVLSHHSDSLREAGALLVRLIHA